MHRVLLAEFLGLLRVGAVHPACGGDLGLLEGGVDAVFVLQPIRHDVELQRAHRTENQVVAHQRPEELGRAFLAQLGQAFLQLLEFQRIAQARATEQLGREVGNAGEMQRLASGKAVADRDGAVVVDADHVAGVGGLDDFPIRGHEGQRVRQLHFLAGARLQGLHAGVEAAGADAQKGDAVAVLRIHVRLDLEHEAREGFLIRRHFSRGGGAWLGRRRVFDEKVEQQLHAEVVHRRTEEHRCLFAGQVGRLVERMRRTLHEFEFVTQIGQHARADACLELRGVDRSEDRAVLTGEVAPRLVQVDLAADQVHHALEPRAHADRPGHRCALNAEDALDLIQQVDRLFALAVELVDEAHDRCVAQSAHLHQLDRALFDAFRHVDDHQRGVDRGQYSVGVLAEVGVARGIEQVDDAPLVGELHDRAGDRDAALLLQRHPVRGRVASRLATFHRPGHLDRAPEQQQLLGERGLAGVGMRDDRKRAAAAGFAQVF